MRLQQRRVSARLGRKDLRFADAYRNLRLEQDAPEKIQALIAKAEATCKFDRLRTDMVDAIQESASSAQRVIEIVRAMKTMAHRPPPRKSTRI